jgi:aspartyl-tRNA synthetase
MSTPTFLKRTHRCGELRSEHVGQEVVLNGWVHRWRDHGGVVFIDLRDRYGLVQVVFDPQEPEAQKLSHDVRSEFVIAVKGTVAPRPEGTENPDLATGQVEVRVTAAEILNAAETPPFSISDQTETDEYIRMKYRYVDLRSERMQRNLLLRAKAAQAARAYLDSLDFVEVETPLLFRPTPEGARDYLVPSRVNPGLFYSLPQSPQILKQLLMVGGMDRYYQIARCLRDEDLRADRQPEFTQIDIEMSFVEREDIIEMSEGLYAAIFKAALGVDIPRPFPRLSYAEAVSKYGTDKPDLRFGMEFVDLGDIVKDSEFKVFTSTLNKAGQVKGICARGCGGYARAQLDKLAEFARAHKAQGLAWMRVVEGGVDSPIAKFFSAEQIAQIVAAFGAEPGDLLLMVADTPAIVAESLDWIRREMAAREGLIKPDEFALAWVLDFPLFAWNEEEKRWDAEHHPFCMPHPDDWGYLDTDPGKVRAQSYDVVLNGSEVASGSVRIHRPDIQQKVFDILGISEEEAQARFGFLLNAFKYGAPPHAGIAPGFDRIVAIMCGEDSIRDVIAFPKTQRAQCLMSAAPGEVDAQQLRDLHIKLDLPPE